MEDDAEDKKDHSLEPPPDDMGLGNWKLLKVLSRKQFDEIGISGKTWMEYGLLVEYLQERTN